MNDFMRESKKSALVFVSVFALLLACSLPASAQSAGYDLLQTGSGATIDLSSAGLGVVKLQGAPIQSSLGSTDTIMHRTKDTVGGGTTPVEVTALFMKSVNSVNFQGQSTDIYVTINNSGGVISTDVLPQPDATSSSGTVTVRGDGTFDSSITVNADVLFVPAGSSASKYYASKAASPISLSSTNSTWSSTPPAGYPSSPSFPPGGFFPKPVHNGPHPVVPSTCNVRAVPANPVGTVDSVDSTSATDTKAKTAASTSLNAIAVARCISVDTVQPQ
jgi:hypothetical protein